MHQNPFDESTATFLALVNGQGQWSLWPARIAVPDGWETGFGPAPRQDVLDHIQVGWSDIRVPAGVTGPTNA